MTIDNDDVIAQSLDYLENLLNLKFYESGCLDVNVYNSLVICRAAIVEHQNLMEVFRNNYYSSDKQLLFVDDSHCFSNVSENIVEPIKKPRKKMAKK